MDNKLLENIKQQLKGIDFLRFKVAPLIRDIKFNREKSLAAKKDFIAIEDIKGLAASRHWQYTVAAPKVIQRSLPSKCLLEDALEIVRHGAAIINKHDRRNEDRDYLERMLLANLLSVKRYPVYETFTCEIPDVFIAVPNGAVLTSDFEALIQSSRLDWSKVLMERVPDADHYLQGNFVSLLGWSGQDYGHWLIDILARVTLLPEDDSGLFYLVEDPLPRFKWESLELLGIPRERVIPLAPGWYRLEKLLLCHAAQRYMVPKRRHLEDLRDRFIRGAFAGEEPAPPWRRIYVSREKARRKIVNETEIMPILKDYGFEKVVAEDLSFKDQVRLFAETKVILGPHGAGLNNDFLCRPGATVIELYNIYRYNWCVRKVVNLMGHEHWFMFGENVNPEYDMTVAPPKLEKLLAYVFDQGNLVESIY